MMAKRQALVAAVFVGAGCAVCPSARAQANDPAVADALFRKGREAAAKGDWATAASEFAESQRLDPAPGTVLNIADCEEHLGKLASAYEHFRTAAETMAPGDNRVPFAKQHMASLEKKVPHLTLTVAAPLPPRARVLRDEVELGSASFGIALPLDPGTHAILVSAPGHADRKAVVVLAPGDAKTIALESGDVVASAPPPLLAPAPSVSPRRIENAPPAAAGNDAPRYIGIGVGAAGVAALGVGLVAGAFVLGKKSIVDDPSHCDPTTHQCDATGLAAASDGKTLSTLSTVGFVAGGTLVVAGAVLFLTAKQGAKSGLRAPPALVVPDTYAGGGGASVVGTF